MPWDWDLSIYPAAQGAEQECPAAPVLILHSASQWRSLRATSKTSILLLVQVPTLKKVGLAETKVTPLRAHAVTMVLTDIRGLSIENSRIAVGREKERARMHIADLPAGCAFPSIWKGCSFHPASWQHQTSPAFNLQAGIITSALNLSEGCNPWDSSLRHFAFGTD